MTPPELNLRIRGHGLRLRQLGLIIAVQLAPLTSAWIKGGGRSLVNGAKEMLEDI